MAFKRTKNWKEMNEMKGMRIFSRANSQSFGTGLIIGFVLVSLTYLTMSKNDKISYPFFNSQAERSSRNTSFAIPSGENVSSALKLDSQKMDEGIISSTCGPKSSSCEADNGSINLRNSSTISEEIHGAVDSTPNSEQSVPEKKPLCDFSEHRSAICDIEGDIRIVGKNLSSVILVDPSQIDTAWRNASWVVQPYARKWDAGALKKVTKVNVKALYPSIGEEAPRCSVNHSVPAIIFSIAGHTGNYFHDMTDVLVPLFQTSREFDGQVQFLVTNYKSWWIGKHSKYIKRLTNYEVIDYDNEDKVHCFKHVIVGLRSDKDMIIDPRKSPKGYSMPDFMKFMRDSYGLKRDYALKIDENTDKKPRLLLIARGRTRKFMNVDMIVDMAEKVGFEVVVAEANFNKVADFTRIVNSCDVLLGVHGAGLTNFVFLPMNAVLIQIVPFGLPGWVSGSYFGEPSKHMNLKYIEYKMSEEESTLTDLYSRDDPVFKDPRSIQKLGWAKMGTIYLDKQNVKLDVQRFKPVLEEALRLLH